MALSEAQRRANDKYIAKNYKQVKLSMPKEEAEVFEKFCEERDLTRAGFIRNAIKEKMERTILEEKQKKKEKQNKK